MLPHASLALLLENLGLSLDGLGLATPSSAAGVLEVGVEDLSEGDGVGAGEETLVPETLSGGKGDVDWARRERAGQPGLESRANEL
jgi:hypothetical protein